MNWSSVMALQAYGRIRRQGQLLPTFAFQLVAEDTVDVLLAMLGLRKLSLATRFSKVDRAKGLRTVSYMRGCLADSTSSFETVHCCVGGRRVIRLW